MRERSDEMWDRDGGRKSRKKFIINVAINK